ncbi:MAG: CPBP family intramembrane metalloprotease [Nitrospirae bacterium]|nr:MAG: CPBP family intramembrane metalloprotease [Nitrospirota bacterium]
MKERPPLSHDLLVQIGFSLLLFTLILLYYSLDLTFLGIPFTTLLFLSPFILRQKIHYRFTASDLGEAVLFSTVVLLPFCFLILVLGGAFRIPETRKILFYLFLVAIPEEVYFRGVFQGGIGNNLQAVLYSSLLFVFLHSPRFIITGDISALLTFFPSLLMGYLYMKKKNLLHPILFHFLSDIMFISIKAQEITL